jgi:hypothetical protein
LDGLNDMSEEPKLGQPPRTHAVPRGAETTVVSPVSHFEQVSDDFPTEEEVARRRVSRPLGPSTSPPVPTGVSPFDFSSEIPGDEVARSTWAALFGMPVKAVAWIAAGCAVLAIGEAVVIGELLRSKPKNATTAAGLDLRQAPQPVTDASRGGDPATSGLSSGRPISPGAAVVPVATLNPASSSQLEVTSDPPGAHVTVDDRPRGTTPITLAVSPGPHTVLVTDGTTTSKKTVTAVAGVTATLMASFAPAPAPAVVSAGWLSIHSPRDLQIREGDSLLGTTSTDRLMLPSGRHVLALSNADAGFQTTLTVVVDAGKAVTSTVAIPNGSLSLNALPWANVTIDGQALPGTTPFANLQYRLGPHEIVWSHPQLGERRQTVIVNAKTPARLVVDLRVK